LKARLPMLCRIHGCAMEPIHLPPPISPHWWCYVCKQLWVSFEGALTHCQVDAHIIFVRKRGMPCGQP